MRLRVRQDPPHRFVLTRDTPPGGRLFNSGVALFFIAVGLAFCFFSLPHSEELRCTRDSKRTTCTSSQLLFGRWVVVSRALDALPGTAARVEHTRDEGEDHYFARIAGPAGRLDYGKAKTERAEVLGDVDRVNAFLADAGSPSLAVREDVWWWFAAPFGLLAVAVGVVSLASVNASERWTFDREAGHVRREKRLVRTWRTDSWSARDVRGVAVRENRDDGAQELRLEQPTGARIVIAALANGRDTTARLQEIAARANDLLGTREEPHRWATPVSSPVFPRPEHTTPGARPGPRSATPVG
ncbi:MAG: hypothetical protein ACREON_13545 [Gemmatimonadaceae bacterium]